MDKGGAEELAAARAFHRAQERGHDPDTAEHAAERARHWIRTMLVDHDTALTWALRDAKALQDTKREASDGDR